MQGISHLSKGDPNIDKAKDGYKKAISYNYILNPDQGNCPEKLHKGIERQIRLLAGAYLSPRCIRFRTENIEAISRYFGGELLRTVRSLQEMFQLEDAPNNVNVMDILLYLNGLPTVDGIITCPIWFKQADYTLMYPANTQRIEVLCKIEYDFGIGLQDYLDGV